MQPNPHYCEARPPTGAAGVAGCPHWPACLMPAWREPVDGIDDTDDEPDDDEIPGLAQSLAALACFAAAAVVFLIVVAILLPVIL
jgi:hypothetical protein